MRDLIGDDAAAAGQADDDGVLGRLWLEGRREQPPCDAAVMEEWRLNDEILELGHQLRRSGIGDPRASIRTSP